MCGIAGVQSADGKAPDAAVLRAIVSAMTHRGPDGEGFAHRGATALGFRRLAILDIAGGAQPITGEDGRVAAVVNGELYNHGALRADLEARGHAFRTRTDAEVVVHGYEEWGRDVVSRLSGMFALAVHDARDGTVLLARDAFGQKPLFVAETAGGVAFASEMAALSRHPEVPQRVDPAAFARLLALGTVPAPATILAGVVKLLPGASMVLRGGRIIDPGSRRILRFEPAAEITAERAAAELWDRLVGAAGRTLQSDVPLGVFLSGGIDSAAVAAAVRVADPGLRLPSFSIGFDDADYDEAPFARDLARFLGTENRERTLTAAAAAEIARELPHLLDEPTADSSLLPSVALARLAAAEVRVALGGDGGDEVFAGYDSFAAQRAARAWSAVVPRTVEDALVAPAARMLPAGSTHRSAGARARQFLRGARLPAELRPWGWMTAFAADELAALLADGVAAPDVYADARLAGADADPAEDATSRGCRVLLRTYLPDDLLAKTDRAGMSASLEVRAPLLDDDLAAWALRLPSRLKSRGTTGKRVLRDALRGRVPAAVLTRRKRGFAVPLARWLRSGPLADFAADGVRSAVREFPHLLRAEAATALVDEHRSGRADRSRQVWALAAAGAWAAGRRDAGCAVN